MVSGIIMAKQKKQSLNKKPIVAIVIGLVVAAAVGATIAYRGDIARFFNQATLGESGATFTEEFVSPDNWKPCDTQPKTVIATNTTNKPIQVRVSYEEFWKAQDDTNLPLQQNNINVAVINYDNQADWTLNGAWYYYKEPLQPGESTSSFIKSVTFNCAYNMGSDELNVCDDEGNCTTPANAYGNAKYHLKVTIQTAPQSAKFPPDGYICHSYILYNEIACKTNGLDDQIDFTATVYSGNSNGYGVNTLTAHANDTYPVYYYRGNINYNYVYWAGFCWQAIRTTSTGGVKLLYSGIPKKTWIGTYDCEEPAKDMSKIGIQNESGAMITSRFNEISSTPAEVGYMYGESDEHFSYGLDFDGNGARYFAATGISWDGSAYHFTGGMYKRWAEYTDEEKASIRYTCYDKYWRNMRDYSDPSNVCTVAWAVNALNSKGNSSGVKLVNGETSVQEMLDRAWTNTHDSTIKAKVDAWFATNLADRVDELEDTVFCNDRTVESGFFKDGLRHNNSNVSYYGYVWRGKNGQPYSVDCTNTRDAFTVSSANGNGALTYPVGLLTMDEVALSGAPILLTADNTDHTLTYLRTPYLQGSNSSASYYRAGFWTMTPLVSGLYYLGAGFGGLEMSGRVGYIDNENTGWGPFVDGIGDIKVVRPVVSLKAGAYYVSGNGYWTNPYVIP